MLYQLIETKRISKLRNAMSSAPYSVSPSAQITAEQYSRESIRFRGNNLNWWISTYVHSSNLSYSTGEFPHIIMTYLYIYTHSYIYIYTHSYIYIIFKYVYVRVISVPKLSNNPPRTIFEAATWSQDSTDHARVAEEVTWGPTWETGDFSPGNGGRSGHPESNVATGNPLEMDILMVQSSINGGLSIAMFDYRMVKHIHANCTLRYSWRVMTIKIQEISCTTIKLCIYIIYYIHLYTPNSSKIDLDEIFSLEGLHWPTSAKMMVRGINTIPNQNELTLC